MPWIADNGNNYSLCLLDTNIISEIVKNKADELKKFWEQYPISSHIICITVYSLIELRRNTEVYEKFLEVFSVIPFFILKPFFQLFENERDLYGKSEDLQPILVAITPLSKDPRLRLKNLVEELFSNKEVIESEKMWRADELVVVNNWVSRIENFETTNDVANSRDADRYVEEAGLQTIIRLDLEWTRQKIEAEEIINIADFPSVIAMLYSQYYRLYDPHWKANPQETTDIQIISPSPYVDVVITEKFQAEILRKIKKKVKGMENLEVATLRNIRK